MGLPRFRLVLHSLCFFLPPPHLFSSLHSEREIAVGEAKFIPFLSSFCFMNQLPFFSSRLLPFAEQCGCAAHNRASNKPSEEKGNLINQQATLQASFILLSAYGLSRHCPSISINSQSISPFSKKRLMELMKLIGRRVNFTTCFLHKNQINLVFMLSASCSINLLL